MLSVGAIATEGADAEARLVQVLMSLLKVSEADIAAFHAEMMALNSEKDQRTLLKKFLISSGARCETSLHVCSKSED